MCIRDSNRIDEIQEDSEIEEIRIAQIDKTLKQVEAPKGVIPKYKKGVSCLLYTSPSPRDTERSRMPSSA
ncbi:hypothetical protein JMUB7555_27270 [Staphylococcus aureus]